MLEHTHSVIRKSGYAGTSLFMNYFREVVELSELKQKTKKQTKWIETLKMELMLECRNPQTGLVWDLLG